MVNKDVGPFIQAAHDYLNKPSEELYKIFKKIACRATVKGNGGKEIRLPINYAKDSHKRSHK